MNFTPPYTEKTFHLKRVQGHGMIIEGFYALDHPLPQGAAMITPHILGTSAEPSRFLQARVAMLGYVPQIMHDYDWGKMPFISVEDSVLEDIKSHLLEGFTGSTGNLPAAAFHPEQPRYVGGNGNSGSQAFYVGGGILQLFHNELLPSFSITHDSLRGLENMARGLHLPFRLKK